jgi:hypothetical protein
MKRNNITPPMSAELRECWALLGTAIAMAVLVIGFQIFVIATQ